MHIIFIFFSFFQILFCLSLPPFLSFNLPSSSLISLPLSLSPEEVQLEETAL